MLHQRRLLSKFCSLSQRVLRLAQTIGGAFSDRRAQAALRERIKELTCLYGISQVVQKPGSNLREMLQDIVELLQKAFQYPKIAVARIFLDGQSYTSKEGHYEGKQALKGDIIIGGEIKGFVEVAYLKDIHEIEDGPFIKEEKKLIDEVSRQISLIVEGKKAEEDKLELLDQLRHADRLATTGQLAAGIAHELNEPIGNILGFAQLAKKNPIIQKQMVRDLDKIIEASLHAREVVKKLLVFTRQIPARTSRVNLNQIVTDVLYFLESRCRKEAIDLVHVLSPELPDITADPAQMNQVLVNLVVNSIQAMPAGGKLTVRTVCKKDSVSLIVKDTGTGMSEEVVKQIFVPFFTTKEVGEGTGLGLAIVHGIVTSHGGAIKVDSRIRHGTSFEITLPLSDYKD